jgi:hypothetical protein
MYNFFDGNLISNSNYFLQLRAFSLVSGFANERLQIIITKKETERNRALEEIHR